MNGRVETHARVTEWLAQVKKEVPPESLGMILLHNGVVRGISKSGDPVAGMHLGVDDARLESTVSACAARPGIAAVRVWVNRGELEIGDDIMWVLVAGDYRTTVIPALEDLVTEIKTQVVEERETRA